MRVYYPKQSSTIKEIRKAAGFGWIIVTKDGEWIRTYKCKKI